MKFRITGEPLFGNAGDGFMYSDEPLGYGSSNEHSPSALQAAAAGFDFRPHPNELHNFLSAAVGHPQFLHGAVNFNPDASDDDDDEDDAMSEPSDDIDEDDDAQSDGDESSVGELDE